MDRLADLVIAFLAVYGMVVLAKRFNHWLYVKSLGEKLPAVSWVLLVKDQEQVIEGLLRQLTNICRDDPHISDLFVVDQGSRDTTVEIARRLSANNREFVVLEKTGNRGLDSIIEKCRGRAICIFDLKRLKAGELPGVALRISQRVSQARHL